MISMGNGEEPIGKVDEIRETTDGIEVDYTLNKRGLEMRREALLREGATEEEALANVEHFLGGEVIAEYENKPEYVLIAAVREDPHAFDGMWYPTALSEDGISMLYESDPARFDSENLFFIRVSTDSTEWEDGV